MTKNIVDRAMSIALTYHDGQRSPHSDEPYILHPMRVFIATRDGGLDEEHQAVAWLHDTLEDTALSFFTLQTLFGDDIALAVDAMSKRRGEDNLAYYQRCKLNAIARRVKIHDINENFGRNHMITNEEAKTRMAKKYSLGLDILCRTHV